MRRDSGCSCIAHITLILYDSTTGRRNSHTAWVLTDPVLEEDEFCTKIVTKMGKMDDIVNRKFPFMDDQFAVSIRICGEYLRM